jgi:radical SAM protein with 4Fe4S-binding SPASM domain
LFKTISAAASAPIMSKSLIDKSFIEKISLSDSWYLDKMRRQNVLVSLGLELTARCNNNCRHCYINLPASDKRAEAREISYLEIKNLVDQAAGLGVLWCLLTGGEPLLRKDFYDIYIYLKTRGILVSVFTNATLIRKEHIDLFKKYPPRDVEVTVYGVTAGTYERITRVPGSFKAFIKGLNLLLDNKIRVRFKTVALRSNIHELRSIAKFCRKITKDYYRFDPFINLRFDGNRKRNRDIKSERLSPKQIVELEKSDPERKGALERNCDRLIFSGNQPVGCNHLFRCGIGRYSCVVGYDGFIRACPLLIHPDYTFDLKKMGLAEFYQDAIPQIRERRSRDKGFLKQCRVCPLVNLCMWCPANAYLETKKLDKWVKYFCDIAHSRAGALPKSA